MNLSQMDREHRLRARPRRLPGLVQRKEMLLVRSEREKSTRTITSIRADEESGYSRNQERGSVSCEYELDQQGIVNRGDCGCPSTNKSKRFTRQTEIRR